MNSDPRSPRSLFMEAVETVPPERWNDFLDGECREDSQLRQQVLRLLNAHRESGDFLSSPVAGVGAALAQTIVRAPPVDVPISSVGARIGPYKLLEQIGEGGMGVVYVAEQTEPIRRRVALKIIKPGMDSKQVIARFEAERQALAMMDHPHIARVLDAGMSEAGLPYFVMELVRGMPITEYCDKAKLTPDQRVELFVAVCQAVQHAHQKGIIHRDLKPSNVLVTLHDGKPIPKVIDFGVAKAIGQQLTENTIYTAFTQLIGTPLYMSPEQAELSGLDIDTRSDVYSLGVLLYELLTGHTPFDSGTLIRCGLDEMRRLLREVEPPRPSHRVSTLKAAALSTTSANRGLDERQLSRTLSGELDWIVMKAMEKERDRRHESASALAADLQRYLHDEPVQACPPSAGYRLRKFARRHRGVLSAAGLVLTALFLGTAVSVWYALVAGKAKQDAVDANVLADERRVSAERSASEAEFQAKQARQFEADAKFRAKQARQFEAEAIEQRDQTALTLYNSDIRLAHADIGARNAPRAAEILLRHFPYPGETDRRGWEWHYLLGQSQQAVQTVFAHSNAVRLGAWSPNAIRQVAWSPNGELAASVSSDGSARVWDTATWKLVRTFDAGGTIKDGVKWSPDSQQLAWGSCSDESALRVWHRPSDEVSVHPGHKESIWTIAWSHDGRRIASAGLPPENVLIWNVEDGYSHRVLSGAEWNIEAISWSPDDKLLAATGQGRPLCLWDVTSGELLSTEPIANCGGSDWHPALPRIAVGTLQGECLVWDQTSRTVVRRWAAHAGRVSEVAWSPDGALIATCGGDGLVKTWESSSGTEVQACTGHRGNVTSVAWGPQGKQLISGGFDGTLRVWDARPKPVSKVIETHSTGVWAMAWMGNDTLRTMRDYSHQVYDWNTVDGTLIRQRELSKSLRYRLMSSRLATQLSVEAPGDPQLGIWDLDTLQRIDQVAIPGLSSDKWGEDFYGAFSPDGGKLFVVSDSEQSAILVDLRTRMQHRTKSVLSYQGQAAWSPNVRFAASVGGGLAPDEGTPKFNGYVHLIDGQTGVYLRRFQVGSERRTATSLAWSPDSTKLAASNDDGLCELFDAATGNTLVSRRVHTTSVPCLEWSPDGRRLASGAVGREVRVWDADTGEELLVLGPHDAPIHSVRWSPDGRRLAAASTDGVIRIWDATPGFQVPQTEVWARMLEQAESESIDALVQRGDWRQAAAQCERVLTRPDAPTVPVRFRAALLSYAAGDKLRYRQQCLKILEAIPSTNDPELAGLIVWTCTLAPDGLDDYAPAVDLAQRPTPSPADHDLLMRRGGILMRAGRLEEAREQLLAATKAETDGVFLQTYARYLLAMTQQRLGQTVEARKELARANEQSATQLSDPVVFRHWIRRLTLQLLRDEATALIAPRSKERTGPEKAVSAPG